MTDEPIEVSIWEPGFRKIREKLEATIAEQAAEINVLTNSEHYRIVELEVKVAKLERLERAARAWRDEQPWSDHREYDEPDRALVEAVDALERGDD